MKVIANAYPTAEARRRFVLHVHNRFFRGLGWKRVLGQRVQTLLGRPMPVTSRCRRLTPARR